MKQTFFQSVLLPLIACMVCLTVGGCNQKMAVQPSYGPLAPDELNADDMSAREPPPGTVARDSLQLDTRFYLGKKYPTPDDLYMAAIVKPEGTAQVLPTPEQIAKIPYVEEIPIEMDEQFIERGKARYTIFCAVCHDDNGTGRGPVVLKGFTEATTFHSDRLRQAPAGYLFDVSTNGLGPMPSYRHQVPTRDRWAIIAYIRKMQENRPPDDTTRDSSTAPSPDSGGTSVD